MFLFCPAFERTSKQKQYKFRMDPFTAIVPHRLLISIQVMAFFLETEWFPHIVRHERPTKHVTTGAEMIVVTRTILL